MTIRKTLLALPLAAALSGCLSFGAKPPPYFLRLTAAEAPQGNASRSAPAAQAITVVPPIVPQELATTRVPVRTGANQVAYLPNASWEEAPNALFARLLSDTIAARTGRVVLDPRQFTLDPGIRLTGTLRSFGLVSDSNEAVVVYEAAIARGPDRVETRTFEARAPATLDPAGAARALNTAANQVAADVAAWVG
jgi:cholesterol transport system auxiliary component